METNSSQTKILRLGWLDPKTDRVINAGVAFYNSKFGEYFLKIDEEPAEKQYFLKPFSSQDEKVLYRVELIIRKKDGSFRRRQKVGEGFSSEGTQRNVHINYGSKYKTLVLYLED